MTSKEEKKQINDVRNSIQGIDKKSVTQESRSATWRGNSSRELRSPRENTTLLKVNVSMSQTKSTAKGITKSLEEAEIISRMPGMVRGRQVQISVKKTTTKSKIQGYCEETKAMNQ